MDCGHEIIQELQKAGCVNNTVHLLFTPTVSCFAQQNPI